MDAMSNTSLSNNTEIFNQVYKNTEMGTTSISELLKVVDDDNLKKTLTSQLNEYESIKNQAKREIRKAGAKPQTLNSFTKASSGIMIGLNTLMDKSPSHVSKMMIEGSTMGIVEITKCINDYENAPSTSKEAIELAKKLLACEQNNVEQCKQML